MSSNRFYDEIDIDKNLFQELIYWTLLKYKLDPNSRRHFGQADKIGGFIDRFSNTCSNWLVLDHVLKDLNITVVRDYFLYTEKSAKKCADVIGVKNALGKIIPFTSFNKTKWDHFDDKPFIEVKTFRKDQYNIALDEAQFYEDHYYCFVESDFDENYLLSLFDNQIHSYFNSMKMPNEMILDNSLNYIFDPYELSTSKKIGSLRLLGIYKAKDIKANSKLFSKKGEQPIFLKSDDIYVNPKIPKTLKNQFHSIILKNNQYSYSPLHVPLLMSSNSINLVYNVNKKTKAPMNISDNYHYVYSNQEFYINEKKIPAGYAKLIFSKMPKESDKKEYIAHKALFDQRCPYKLKNGPIDCTQSLKETIKRIATNKS